MNIGRLVELINTMRTFLRVSTGLVRIMSSSSSSLLLLLPPPPPPPPLGANNSSPPNDKTTKAERRRRSGVISVVARSGAEVAQMALLSVYQIYENIGFLTDQGILSSSSSSSGSGEDDSTTTASVVVKNYYLTSSRAWMGSVVFSILSTLLATISTCENTKEKEKEKGWWWWKSLAVPIGINLPLSAHASFEKGLLADEVVALMGLVVSGLGLRKGWRDTEEEEEEKEEGKEEGKEE